MTSAQVPLARSGQAWSRPYQTNLTYSIEELNLTHQGSTTGTNQLTDPVVYIPLHILVSHGEMATKTGLL